MNLFLWIVLTWVIVELDVPAFIWWFFIIGTGIWVIKIIFRD